MQQICYSLGIPDTSLRGLNTRTARSVLRSKSEPTVDRILERNTENNDKGPRQDKVSQGLTWDIVVNSGPCTNRGFDFSDSLDFFLIEKNVYKGRQRFITRAHVNLFTSRRS